MTCGGVPDADVVDGAGGEEVGVAGGERDVIDALVVASVSELWLDGVGVAPVDGGLRGAGEEVSGVSRERDRGASAHDLLLPLQFHHLMADLDLGDCAIS